MVTDLDLTNIPEELKLILEIIKSKQVTSLTEINCNNASEINWNHFLELAMHHRVYPLLYNNINNIPENIIPNHVIQILKNNYKVNTFEMLRLSAEMDMVSKLLNANDIELIFLKGPVLAVELYGNLSHRTCGDIDMLVPIEKLHAVEDLLLINGYEKDDYIHSVLGDWKWRHHHFTYFHPEKKIKLEVHWRLNPGPGKEPTFRDLWEKKRISTITDSPIYFLGKEDLFLFLVSHGARHGWSRLRWLSDIQHILFNDLNWTELYKLLKKYHYLKVGGQAIILCSQLFDTKINSDMEKLLNGKYPMKLANEAIYYLEKMVNLHTEPLPEDVSIYHQRHLFSQKTIAQKAIFLISTLYPYYTDVETVSLPKHLHFLYFPLRPFLFAWRKTKNHGIQ